MFPTKPRSEDTPVTFDHIKNDYDKWHDDKFTEFFNKLKEGDKLFHFIRDTGGHGHSGYYRLEADGSKTHYTTSTWMH